MTGEPTNEIEADSRRRRLLDNDVTTSRALEQTLSFTRRGLLLGLGFAMLLAFTSLARAASSATSAKLSARLTQTEFVASQVKSVKLVYKLPASSKSLTYRLTLKQGATWKPINSAKQNGGSASSKRLTVGKLFGNGSVRVGFYRLQVSSAGLSKILSFRISPFYGRLTKKSFTIAEAKSIIKLTYGFSKPSKSFAYKLLAKKGSSWKLIKSAKTTKKSKRQYLVGVKTAGLKKLFGGKKFALGRYRFRISSAYSTRQLNFKIVKSANPAASTGGSGSGSGTGSGSTGGADFTISGNVDGLEPGLTLPVRLTLTNPNSTRIYVTRLTISMSAGSTPSGCSRDGNFEIIQSDASSSSPISVPAKGKVTLTSAPSAPQISFLNLPLVNQDVCKGKSFVLTFTGSAHS
jgi:hypothetical protein